MGKWRWWEVNRTDFTEQLRMERMLTKERKHSKQSKKKKKNGSNESSQKQDGLRLSGWLCSGNSLTVK